MVRVAVLCGILLFSGVTYSQVRLNPVVAEKLLIERPDPVYPELAKKARIAGNIYLTIHVTETGSVSEVLFVSGHPVLKDAAVTMARQSRYKPFISDNKATPFIYPITVPFYLDLPADAFNKDQRLAVQYTDQEHQCRELMGQSKWVEAEASCKANIEIADKMSRLKILLKMEAYELAGFSLLNQNKYEETMQYLKKAQQFGQNLREDYRSDFGNLLLMMGVTCSKMNRLNDAMDYYDKGIQSLQQLYDNPNINSKIYEKEKNLCLSRLKKGLDYQIKAAESLGKTKKAEDLKKRLAALP